MQSNGSRIIKKVMMAVLFFVIINGAVLIGGKYLLKHVSRGEDTMALREERDTVVKKARELDTETQKIVLTDELLKLDYRIHYAYKKDSNGILDVFIYGAAGVAILAGVLSFIFIFFSSKFSIKKSISCLVTIPIALGIVWLLQQMSFYKLPPAPDEAEYDVNVVEIVDKNIATDETRDENGRVESTSHSYRIYFTDRAGERQRMALTEDEYNAIRVHSIAYVASAAKGDEIAYYKYYNPLLYKPSDAKKPVNVAGFSPGNLDDVDREILRKRYTQFFPEQSFAKEDSDEDPAKYLVRLEVKSEDWKKAKETLEKQGWIHKTGAIKSFGVRYAERLFDRKEVNKPAAYYHIMHDIDIPGKRTVDEEIVAISKEDGSGVTVLYYVYVYHE